MASRPDRPYAAQVSVSFRQRRTLAHLARVHRNLFEIATPDDELSIPSLLILGSAITLHGELEGAILRDPHPLLDEAAFAQLALEHAQLSRDLRLVDVLWRENQGSPDLAQLCASMRRRLKDHAARDQRILYDSLERFGILGGEESDEP